MGEQEVWYIFSGGKVRAADVDEYTEWLRTANRTFYKTVLEVEPCARGLSEPSFITISTVFLAIDHSYGGPEPVLWETMVFDEDDVTEHNQACWRATSAVEAEGFHATAVEDVTNALRKRELVWDLADNQDR